MENYWRWSFQPVWHSTACCPRIWGDIHRKHAWEATQEEEKSFFNYAFTRQHCWKFSCQLFLTIPFQTYQPSVHLHLDFTISFVTFLLIKQSQEAVYTESWRLSLLWQRSIHSSFLDYLMLYFSCISLQSRVLKQSFSFISLSSKENKAVSWNN